MRIAFLLYGSPDTLTGGYLYDRQVIQRWRAWGHSVEIVSLPWHGYARSLLDNVSPALHRRLAALNCDVLIQDELCHPSLLYRNRRLPYSVLALVHLLHSSAHNWAAPQRILYRAIEKRYLQQVDGWIFVSRATQNAALALGLPAKPQMIALPAGDHLVPQVTASQIAARARTPSPLRILFLGNLVYRKGLHTLLHALRALPPAAAWTLTVLGAEDFEPRYAAQMHALAAPLGERVRFLGRVPNAQIGAHLAQSDILAAPAYAEGYAIAYLEAMAHGLPVFASNVGGAPELIRHGENGFLLPPHDPSAWRTTLESLLSRAALEPLSLAARHTFDTHPTWDDAARAILAFSTGDSLSRP
ncbi:MAG: glycosyltransferase [Anaerolineales bacterium]